MNSFLEALQASGPAPERGAKMDLYGWLIGSWDLEVSEFPPQQAPRRRSGEWHFGWALEGRAIQDVWIVPKRGPDRGLGRDGDPVARNFRYGTTLRIYDPQLDAWHIQWSEPIHQVHWRMIGRAEGGDIVQLGELPDGTKTRWSFREIKKDSFLWRGELQFPGKSGWYTNIEFRARRVGAA